MPLRDIIVTDGCLGMLPGRTLEIGDIQHMAFQVDDNPPLKYSKGFPPATTYIGMPCKFDRPTPFKRREFDKKLEAAKKAKAKKKNSNLQTAGENTLTAVVTEIDDDVIVGEDHYIVKGYVGKPKGILQVWYERGLYHHDMHGKIIRTTFKERFVKGKEAQDPANDAFAVLDSCRDFAEETTQLEELFISRGYILVSSVNVILSWLDAASNILGES